MKTLEEMKALAELASAAARAASAVELAKWGGDFGCCGFAWTTIYPEHKGNTRLGKQERALYEAIGFSKDWTGKAYQLWDPGNTNVQNIDVKEKGAAAYAAVLRNAGINAACGSRVD